MKEKTRELLNKQIGVMLKEVEQIDNIKDRLELRIQVVQTIYNISESSEIENLPQGKESIKEDKAKKPIVMVEEYEEDIPEIPEEMVNEVEPKPELPEIEEEITVEEIIEAGQELKPEVAAKAAAEIECEEVNLDEPERIIVEDTDITDVFNMLNPEISKDFREELSLQIIEYNVVDEYKTLDHIEEVDDGVISEKILLAYWVQQSGLETMEYFVNYFASNIEVDENDNETYIDEELHLDFINENNIKGFNEYVESCSE